MTPLPADLGGKGLVCWRLERESYLPTWTEAEGAFQVGGRWSSPGRRVLYAAIDPATAILEVAVHKGFDVLDTVAHRLLCIRIAAAANAVRVVQPDEVPNPSWLSPSMPSVGQQRFGDALLDAHAVVLLPNVVSRHSWNCLIDTTAVPAPFELEGHERFGLDARLTQSRKT